MKEKKETGSRKNGRLGSRKSARRIPNKRTYSCSSKLQQYHCDCYRCKGSGGLLGLRRYLWIPGYKKRDTICCSNCSGKCCTVVEQGMQRAEVMKKGPGLGIPSSKVRSHGARRPFDDPTSDVIPFCSLPVEYPNYSISNSGMDHERFCL